MCGDSRRVSTAPSAEGYAADGASRASASAALHWGTEAKLLQITQFLYVPARPQGFMPERSNTSEGLERRTALPACVR